MTPRLVATDVIDGSEFGLIPARLRHGFSSSRGDPEINPYVDRIHELGAAVVLGEHAASHQGRWRDELGFGSDAALLLEIGPGNGFFFRDLALSRPDAGLVGIEIRFKRVFLTAKKALEAGATNVRVLHQSFGYLDLFFAPGEVNEAYINHPDPWPKDKQHKHRIVQPSFAALLASRVRAGGFVQVQSDFAPYGPLSRCVFGNEQWSPLAFTMDLHGAQDAETLLLRHGHIPTNYERKKVAAGERIFVGRWRRTDAPARKPTPDEEHRAREAARG